MSSTSNCETKQENTNKNSQSNTENHLSYLVQPNLHGKQQRLPSLKVLWIRIFSYSGPSANETMQLRRLCKLFSKALKPLPKGSWTSYPHPKYSSLRWLFGRINKLSKRGSTNIPKLVLIEKGIHDEGGNEVVIYISISIVGESREHCVVLGGLKMDGKNEDDVNVSNLTLRKSKENGVVGWGASIHLDNVSVENSGYHGVAVYNGSKRNTMKNCNVSHSKCNGLYVYGGGLMKIDGNATTIHHNGKSDGYGLLATSSSSIHLVSPLTKEMISTNNHFGQNYNTCSGTIQTITNNNTKEEKK